MTQVGAPAQGEVLAGRYRLDELLYSDPQAGHALWRGTDGLLNRPVSIEIRVPGGAAAEAMINAAVTAGRIVHPCVVGVYDAVDEGSRAYVVREWVEGYPLLDALADGPLDAGRTAVVTRAVADALAAIHASGQAHGNLQPLTVLVGVDDGVTLTDLRLDGDQQTDVRAVGALLYACLTGHWPAEVPPHEVGLPQAVTVDGRTCSPRQVRVGIPGYLDALTMDLLDPAVPTPSAGELASELRRFDVADPDTGPLSVITPAPASPRPGWKRAGVLVAGLVVLLVLVAGLNVAFTQLGGGGSGLGDGGSSSSPSPAARAEKLEIERAILLDPPGGDFAEARGLDNVVDGDSSTVWRSDAYRSARLGRIKPGMGIILDLGSPKTVRSVTVAFANPGVTFQLRAGDAEPGDRPTDPSAYPVVSQPQVADKATAVVTLKDLQPSRYLVVWIIDTGQTPEGEHQAVIKDIVVEG